VLGRKGNALMLHVFLPFSP